MKTLSGIHLFVGRNEGRLEKICVHWVRVVLPQ